MTFSDLRRKSLKNIKDASMMSEQDVSDCSFDAIQELQTNSLCSRMEVKKLIDVNGEISTVDILDGGSGYLFPPTVTITDNNDDDCLSFDGNDYGSFTTKNIGTTHTIEFWLDASNKDFLICSRTGGTGGVEFDSTDKIYYSGNSTSQASKSITALSPGTKHHFAITRNDSTTITFYQNGASLGTSTISSNTALSLSAIGYRAHGASLYYVGKLGLFRIYKSALTAEQIKRQYNGGYGNSPLDIDSYLTYEFDGTGGTGSTETDQSTDGGSTLTINGATRSTFGNSYLSSTEKAKATAFIEKGIVTKIVITNQGRGYIPKPIVTISGGGGGTGAIAVAEIATTTYDKIITSKFGGSTTGDIDVECLYVDSMYRVGLDGTKNPIKITNRQSIQDERDNGANYNDASDYTAAIEWNKNNIHIFTPWDMTGSTIELWIRFQIPYVQDANVGTNADSYLDTIPVQFQNRLVSGVKYHIYESMEEMSGFSGKYKPMMDIFGNQWFNRDLPYVKQEANHARTSADVHIIKPSGVF